MSLKWIYFTANRVVLQTKLLLIRSRHRVHLRVREMRQGCCAINNNPEFPNDNKNDIFSHDSECCAIHHFFNVHGNGKRGENKNIHCNQASDVFINHGPRWIQARADCLVSWETGCLFSEGQRLEIMKNWFRMLIDLRLSWNECGLDSGCIR